MRRNISCGIIIFMMMFSLSCFGARWTKGILREYFKDEKVVELTYAAIKDDIKKIDKLVKEGVDVNYRGKHDYTPLACCILVPKGYMLYIPEERNIVVNEKAKNLKAFERLCNMEQIQISRQNIMIQ